MNLQYTSPNLPPRYGRLIAAAREHEKRSSGKPFLIGIERAALERNVDVICKRIKDRTLCVVLKGDAYGHGIENVLPFLKSKCSHVAIVDNYEAEKVRAIAPTLPIIRLRAASPTEINAAIAASWNVRELVGTIEKARQCNSIALQHGVTLDLHISLDVAELGRNGLAVNDETSLLDLLKDIMTLEAVRIRSIGCHFPDVCGDRDRHLKALRHFVHLARAIQNLSSQQGHGDLEVSSFSSASSCAFGDLGILDEIGLPSFDRIGSSIYGLSCENKYPEIGIRQVMHALCAISEVHWRRNGTPIGYERSYSVTKVPGERIALASIGWLSLSRYQQGLGKTKMPAFALNEHGHRHYFVGRQSMNISTLQAESSEGFVLEPGNFITLTTDCFGPQSPTLCMVSRWMGGVQPEFVTSSFGGTNSSSKFVF